MTADDTPTAQKQTPAPEQGDDIAPQSDTNQDTGQNTGEHIPDDDALQAEYPPKGLANDTDDTAAPDTSFPGDTSPPSAKQNLAKSPIVGFVAGGVVAASLGFGAAYIALPRDTVSPQATDPDITARLQAHSDTLITLEAAIAALPDQITAPEIPQDVLDMAATLPDLTNQIQAARGQINALNIRVATLEARPVFTGDIAQDSAQLTATVDALRGQLRQQQDVITQITDDLNARIAAMTDLITQAETRAGALMETADLQSAITTLRLALISGEPFAGMLDSLPSDIGLSQALSDIAETGAPSLQDLQTQFISAARNALPAALQSTAGDSYGERFGTFLRGQFGGRSLTPRAGDSADAILSRAEAALGMGDIQAALDEIATLPQAARDVMADWVDQATLRQNAEAALAAITSALRGAN
jgi:hypothetical protein